MTTGALKNKYDRRNYRLSGIQAPVKLPESFRINDPFPVKDQNGFGSCTAQSTVGHKQIQEGIELSARFAYAMTKKLEGNKSWGAYTSNQFKVLCDIGAVCETEYPERHDITEEEYLDWDKVPLGIQLEAEKHKSKSYWFIDNDFESLCQAIYQNKQAVVISVPWYNSYNAPKDGYLKLDTEKGWKYGHAVLVVGWTGDYLIVKNSFGKNWGLDGMCYFHGDFPIWDGLCSLDINKKLPVEERYGKARNLPLEIKTAFNPWLIRKIKRLPSNLEIAAICYGAWSYEEVFKGKVGDTWLYNTKY